MTIEDFADKVDQLGYVSVEPVHTRHWLRSLALDWPHRDPADRVIVALAQSRGMGLLTKDREITGFYPRAFW
jgi:PIN domain nuclease of toxin-antitoxin system